MKDKGKLNKDTCNNFPELPVIVNEIDREHRKLRYYSVLRSTISALIVVAAIVVLIATLWFPVLHIYGVSMAPTLNDGEIVVLVKSNELEKGDLVAFYYGNNLLIKRCIAGPGEWVNIDEIGNVYVNGKYLNEPYVLEKALGECDIKMPYQVPSEKWFLMGDSREVSIDSRITDVGCISEEQIVGKLLFRVWPLKSFGLL